MAAAPIVTGVALRDDDAAPLALGAALARLTGAPLALVSAACPVLVLPRPPAKTHWLRHHAAAAAS